MFVILGFHCNYSCALDIACDTLRFESCNNVRLALCYNVCGVLCLIIFVVRYGDYGVKLKKAQFGRITDKYGTFVSEF